MGNGNVAGEKKDQQQKSTRSKIKQSGDLFNRRKSGANLVFYACTDKAQV